MALQQTIRVSSVVKTLGCHEDIPQQRLGLAGPEPSPAAIARLNGMNALYVLAVYSTEGG